MPSTPAIKIAIAGFTGRFAQLITSHLLTTKPSVTIHGICRDVSKVPSSVASNPQVKLFTAESTDSAALRIALSGVDVCVCSYLGDPSLMVEGQRILIDACIAETVPRYISSDYSFDFRGLKLGDFPFKDFQVQTANYLAEQEAGGRIKAVHILNGAFTEVVFSPMLGVYEPSSSSSTSPASSATSKFKYYGTGKEPWDFTTISDSAAFVGEIACDTDATGVHKIRGDMKSISEIAAIYSKVYGVPSTLEKQGSLEELQKTMFQKLEEKPEDMGVWLGLFYNEFMSNGVTSLGEEVRNEYEMKGLKPRSLEQFFGETGRESLAGLMG